MTTVLIIYASSLGNTKRMADAIAEGARGIDSAVVRLKTVDETSIDDVWACDALVLGSPVRQGSADARVRNFIEVDCERLMLSGRLATKVGAVFTVGANPHGRHGDGAEIAQLAMLRPLAAGGMTLVSGPCEWRSATMRGPYWGPHARLRMQEDGREVLQEGSVEAGHLHGYRIAQASLSFKHAPLDRPRRVVSRPRIADLFNGMREHMRSVR